LTRLPGLRRWLYGLALGVLVALGGAALVLTDLGQDFEKSVGLSWLFKIRGAIEAPPEAVVVAIDGRTGDRLGLPALPRNWPRSVHGRLVDNLVRRGASVIVFDMDLQHSRSAEEDIAFAESVAGAGRVVLFEVLDGQRQPIFDSAGTQIALIWKENLIGPVAPLADAAKGLGPFPLPKDYAAVDTFWSFKPSVDAPTAPAVALQLLALGSHDRWLDLLEGNEAPGVDSLTRDPARLARAADVRALMRGLRRAFQSDPGLGERIRTDLDGPPTPDPNDRDRRLLEALTGLYQGRDERVLNFYGPPGSVTNIPYHAFLTEDPRFTDATLDMTGKVAFVGFSDLYNPGQVDRFYTVFSQRASEGGVDLSGVEIMATAFANLLTDRSLRQTDAATTLWIVLLFGLAVGALSYIPHAMAAAPLTLAAGLIYGIAAQHLFEQSELWLPLAAPMLLQLPAALFLGLGGHYWLERREKMRFSAALNYYLPAGVAQDLTDTDVAPGALNRVVDGTCLATDMSGFTTISEQMRPQELAQFMNDYFDTLAAPLKQHFVEVTEFHADSIMCAWIDPEPSDSGAPPDTTGRTQAVLAALEVGEAVNSFMKRHPPFQLNARIGLEAGRFFLGHTGGGGQLIYSIVGDCANTASRLEGLNKHLGTHILATEPVVAGIEDVLVRPLGRFQFVGKADARPVVEILGKTSELSDPHRRLCADFTEALALFQAEEWAEAAKHLEAILDDQPDDGPSKFYVELCRRYQLEPPLSEDATVIRMQAK
jgi:adenylate cyclase